MIRQPFSKPFFILALAGVLGLTACDSSTVVSAANRPGAASATPTATGQVPAGTGASGTTGGGQAPLARNNQSGVTLPGGGMFIPAEIAAPVNDGGPARVYSLALNKLQVLMSPGQTTKVQAIVTMTDSKQSGEVTWASADPAIAKIDADGSVTGVSKGITQVTATAKADGAVTATCEVQVGTLQKLEDGRIVVTF